MNLNNTIKYIEILKNVISNVSFVINLNFKFHNQKKIDSILKIITFIMLKHMMRIIGKIVFEVKH